MKCPALTPPAVLVLFLAWFMARLSSSRPASETDENLFATGSGCCNTTQDRRWLPPEVADLATTTTADVSLHVNSSTETLRELSSGQPLSLDHAPATAATVSVAAPAATESSDPAKTPSGSDAPAAPFSDDYVDYYYYQEMDYGFADSAALGSSPENRTVRRHPSAGANRIAKLKLVKTPRRHPPEYMLDLYDRFSRAHVPTTAKTTSSAPPEDNDGDGDLSADIVRSFPNINKEDAESDVTDSWGLRQTEQLPGMETRYHTLVFNITSLLLSGEQVSRAELRLYTLVARDRHTYQGLDRLVAVHEGLGMRSTPPVTSRHVYGHASGWEAFDVTEVIRRRVDSGGRGRAQEVEPTPAVPEAEAKTDGEGPELGGVDDGVQVLEVSIASVFRSGEVIPTPDLEIDVDPEHDQGPLLVVFSRDTYRHRQRELQDLIGHEPESEEAERVSLLEHGPGPARDFSSVRNYRDTHSAVLARGNWTSSSELEENEAPLRRVRREKRKRNSCRRTPLYVDFQEINWHQWIIAPPGFQAFECVGKCYVPIGPHLSPTKHAIIQTLIHAAYPKRASRACCVPTKLDPISILYLDENGVITYKYHYDGMVVAECGCR